MQLSPTSYHGWPSCYRFSNEKIDLLLTGDVGPRVLRFGFVGQENQFQEFGSDLGETGGESFRLYGGHRLWHAPEARPRTYSPDNSPLALEEHGDFVRLVQPVETTTRIQKEIDIHLDRDQAQATLVHRLRNTNVWPVELAPWALTLMAPGGTVLIPLPPRGSIQDNLLPTSTLVLWAYTDLSDPRWSWGERVILLRNDLKALTPQKIGLLNSEGWLAYQRGAVLFVKRFDYQPGATYPDLGSSAEVFTRGEILELESLGPLARLEPGGVVEHTERWYLFDGLPPMKNPQQAATDLLPFINQTR